VAKETQCNAAQPLVACLRVSALTSTPGYRTPELRKQLIPGVSQSVILSTE